MVLGENFKQNFHASKKEKEGSCKEKEDSKEREEKAITFFPKNRFCKS